MSDSEDALRESEHRFAVAFRKSPLPAAILRISDDRFVAVNPAFVQAFGYSQEQVIGSTPRELELYVQIAERDRLVQNLRDGLPVANEELVFRAKSGQAVTALTTMHRISYQGEACVFGTGLDITERKRAEADLRREREVLQTIFDHSPIMFCFFGADGRTLVANRSWQDVFGPIVGDGRARKDEFLAAVLPDAKEHQRRMDALEKGAGDWTQFNVRARDGRLVALRVASIRLSTRELIVIADDITDAKRVEERLRVATEQLRALFLKIASIREEQGRMIAREIHDELGSVLTGFRWELESVQEYASRLAPEDAKAIRSRIEAVLRNTDRAVETIRRVASELRPALLDGSGLADALGEYARNFESRTGIRCRFAADSPNAKLSDEIGTALYRIAHEALANVARHAGATEVDVILSIVRGDIRLSIRDNGRGITDAERNRHGSLGLLGMRERAQSIGGEFCVAGSPGQGTTVSVHVTAALPAV